MNKLLSVARKFEIKLAQAQEPSLENQSENLSERFHVKVPICMGYFLSIVGGRNAYSEPTEGLESLDDYESLEVAVVKGSESEVQRKEKIKYTFSDMPSMSEMDDWGVIPYLPLARVYELIGWANRTRNDYARDKARRRAEFQKEMETFNQKQNDELDEVLNFKKNLKKW